MNRIGLFGGTFNPFHLGHIKVAEKVLLELDLNKILFLPSGTPPFKGNQKILDFAKRCELIETSIADNERFELSQMDNTTEKSYTANLIRRLRQQSTAEFIFIIGEDNFFDLPKWYDYEWLLENLKFAVVTRNFERKQDSQVLKKISPDNFHFIKMQPIDISSTMIREKIRNEKSIKGLVHPKIIHKVREFYKAL